MKNFQIYSTQSEFEPESQSIN